MCRDENRDRAGAHRPPESLTDRFVLEVKGLALVWREPGVERHRAHESTDLARRVLAELRHDRRINVAEQTAHAPSPYVVAAEPGPCA